MKKHAKERRYPIYYLRQKGKLRNMDNPEKHAPWNTRHTMMTKNRNTENLTKEEHPPHQKSFG